LSGVRMMSAHREKISKDKQGFIERMIDRRGGYWNLEARSKLPESGPKTSQKVRYFMCTMYGLEKGSMAPKVVQVISETQPCILLKQSKFFTLSGNSLLRESPFHITNCLKSFDCKIFFVYTTGALSQICT